MDGKRTRGWYLTRIELAIAILGVLAGVVAFVFLPSVMFGATPTGRGSSFFAGLLVGLAGLA